jgi:polyisoprenoid-binding protein YceI
VSIPGTEKKAIVMTVRMPRRWVRWIIGAVVVIAALAVGGPFIYIHFFNGSAPAALSLSPAPTAAGARSASSGGSSTTTTTAVAGTWTVGAGSTVGYRVNEVLLGQSTTAVGRSHSVTGHITVQGTTVTAATFSVPMSTVVSDKSQRNAQFDGRIMDVAAYPTGTFTLTKPIALGAVPPVGTIKSYTATGNLTLHGHTRAVTFTLNAERSAGKIDVQGSIPVLFSDWGISNPSIAGFVTTQNHGLLEFLLATRKA